MDLWFVDKRTRRERAELKKHKSAIRTATKRQKKIEKYEQETGLQEDIIRERKAKEELEKKKRLAKDLPAVKGKPQKKKPKKRKKKGYGYIFGTPVKKKRQTRTLSRKSRIRLI